MRTTIDMPDDLLRRVRPFLASRRMTFRALVIDAVEHALDTPTKPFKLRDASAGVSSTEKRKVSSEAINRAIDEARGPAFLP